MHEFEFYAPSSLKEAMDILSRVGDDACPLAGGTDLVVQMKEGRKTPSAVLDVKGIPELHRLDFSPRTGLRLGAAVSCTTIAESPVVRERYPVLAKVAGLIGSLQIQNRATIGGNICNAAPSADAAPPLICLGARAVIAGPQGTREVPLEGFFLGPGRTVLGPRELLQEIAVPPPPAGSAADYLRFTPREEMDIAVVGVGCLVVPDGRRRCREVRIALGAVAPTPVRAREAEDYLVGKALTRVNAGAAAERAAQAASPISDVRGSAAYRLELVKVLTRRCLVALSTSLREKQA